MQAQLTFKEQRKPLPRTTIVSKIQQLHDTEKEAKIDIVAGAKYGALTGDHWTSVSNHNYHMWLHTSLTVSVNFSHLH